MKLKKKVILLAGPTASGKSKLAIKLAQHFNGEIVNADSMQVYKEISILTSKPSITDLNTTKHHLYGFISVKKKFSTGLWLDKTITSIKAQWKRGKTPIIVGGTGLYFKSLTEGLVKIPEIPIKLRIKYRNLHKTIGQEKFYKLLTKLDPLAKKFIIKSDVQRCIRAYEVKKFTHKSLFDFTKKTKPNFNKKIFVKLFINTPRELLNKNIEKRVESFFEEDALQEVKNFLKIKIKKEMSANKIIGMNEISDFLKEKTTLEETKKLIKQKTRQYAKRQFTWARGHMKSWKMIYSSDLNDLFRKAANQIF